MRSAFSIVKPFLNLLFISLIIILNSSSFAKTPVNDEAV